MRTPLVIGNWKLNGSKAMVKAVISELQSALIANSQCQVAIAPPVMYLAQAQQLLRDQQAAAGTPILLAAQNVDSHSIGAFTGDISANMLQEFDVKLVIIGHSERRCYHQENNATIVKKFALLQSVGLMPVLCIGESEAERAMGATESVCTAQLSTVIQTLGAGAFKQAVIAYEPIWAIGSGQSASPEQAQQVHHFIRSYLAQDDAETAAKVRILYGGSVNASNAGQLFAMPDIDGALVGGAALNAHTFTSIIHQMSESGQLS